MNPNEKPKGIWNPAWPSPGAALLRLLLITIVLLPSGWAVFALLVGDWKLNMGEGTEESARHLVEGVVILVAAVSVLFLASLLPVFGWLHRFLGWLLSPCVARRVPIALVWMVTLVVLFYAEEDWRGARAWNKYRQQLEANGAQLVLAAFIPKPVPDEQNFAATPVVKSWFIEVDKTVFTNTTERFAKNWQDNYAQAFERLASPKEKSSRHFMDLVAWGVAFDAIRSGQTNLNQEFEPGKLDLESRAAAVPAVLEGLKINETALAELRIASRRPLSRYPVIYDLDNPWGIFLPHLINVRDACRRLQLRACAGLAAGRSIDALADVKLIIYLADSVKGEPFLISHLVRVACVQIAVQPVWEGLAEHAWSDAQLQELVPMLQQQNFVPDMKRDFDAERAEGIMTVESVRKRGLQLLVEIGGGAATQPSMNKKLASWCGGFIPSGWYYLEQLNYSRLYQLQIEGAFDAAQKRISPGRLKANVQELEQAFAGRKPFDTIFIHHRVIASMLLPALGNVIRRTAEGQVAADQAVLACALERYRLVNQNYPETLDSLEPNFISQQPGDIITGKPFNYRRTSDGQFILYSVGWDEKDNGGTSGKTLFDEKQGDWVWQYPAK